MVTKQSILFDGKLAGEAGGEYLEYSSSDTPFTDNDSFYGEIEGGRDKYSSRIPKSVV